MPHRLTTITTRTGDDGKTSLGTKDRISKTHERIEALGTLDECNSAIGIIIALKPNNPAITQLLKQTQHDLFDLGGELCPPYQRAITPEKTQALETAIQEWNATLPPLQEFILPGGNLKSATCHLARTIARRAERRVISLNELDPLHPEILRYLNRLSDVLFVVARLLARETTDNEELWDHKSTQPN